MTTAQIIDLRIHPIKSCRGISRRSWKITKTGLLYDRNLMFVDGKNEFVTIRDRSEMTLIKTDIDTEGEPTLHVEFPQVEKTDGEAPKVDYGASKKIQIPLEPDSAWLSANTELIPVNIWKADYDGYAITTSEVTQTIADYFKTTDVKLVFKGPTPRPCVEESDAHYLGKIEHVKYQDFLPILVANQASLRDLNQRLTKSGAEEITIERFRPNIIVDGNLKPWCEDEWKSLQINPPTTMLGKVASFAGIGGESLNIDVGLKCLRCQVPNVHPDTAKKDQKQPWTELMSFRRVEETMKYKPVFGMLSYAREEGTVAVGTDVLITEK